MAIINRVAEFHEDMTAWRRNLHMHPEICYEEVWTSDFIAERLAEFGIETVRGLAGTGVVGILKGKTDSGRAIGLRADMDGLPMPEANDFEHKSTTEGRMHACGHDLHVTIGLGVAKIIKDLKLDFGTRIIFQPAEEIASGARWMIKDGATNGLTYILGLHVYPDLSVGTIGI
ncbi:MAG: amidohydrolase, partial [Pseudomonadota bacterium]|nr:amidohydrolase [Pseudomonadota bacterium]